MYEVRQKRNMKMTAEQKLYVLKLMQNLNEKAYLKQRDDEIADALRAKFGCAD